MTEEQELILERCPLNPEVSLSAVWGLSSVGQDLGGGSTRAEKQEGQEPICSKCWMIKARVTRWGV